MKTSSSSKSRVCSAEIRKYRLFDFSSLPLLDARNLRVRFHKSSRADRRSSRPEIETRSTCCLSQVVNLLEEVFAEQFFSCSTDKVCPSCHEGKMGLKLSRFGSGYFLGCSRYPNCMYKTNVLSADGVDSSDDDESQPQVGTPTKMLGIDASSGLEVILKTGPYGNYLQLGSGSKKQKPKRTAIPKDMNTDEIDLDGALELLRYPYELGRHPETDAPILVSTGQYGPFLRCKAVFVSIPKDSITSLTVEQAVALLQSKNVSRRGRKGKSQDGDKTIADDQQKAIKTPAKTSTTKVKIPTTASTKKSRLASLVGTEKVQKKSSGERMKSSKVSGDSETKEGMPQKIIGNGAGKVRKARSGAQKAHMNIEEPAVKNKETPPGEVVV